MNDTIRIKGIVGGQAHELQIEPAAHVWDLRNRMLSAARITESAPETWEVRNQGGHLLAPYARVEDSLVDGDTVFISTRAGVGG